MALVYADEIPAPDEYCALRVLTGLSAMNPQAAVEALPRSLFAVTVRSDARLIGMGRVVGDGLHIQVVDIAVDPDFQGQGISRTIMENIMSYVATLPTSTLVNLFADVDWLYGKFGFAVPDHTTGMTLRRN